MTKKSDFKVYDNPGKFKNDQGIRYLNALFFETSFRSKDTVLYTLKDQDHRGYPSLYRLYMECNDPTEYTFAMKYMDGWEHWKMLCDSSFFKPYIERWREELELRYKADALQTIMREAKAEGRDSLSANKYLLEKGWEKTTGSKRGRPSKEEVTKEAHNIASQNQRLLDDAERLRIVK